MLPSIHPYSHNYYHPTNNFIFLPRQNAQLAAAAQAAAGITTLAPAKESNSTRNRGVTKEVSSPPARGNNPVTPFQSGPEGQQQQQQPNRVSFPLFSPSQKYRSYFFPLPHSLVKARAMPSR